MFAQRRDLLPCAVTVTILVLALAADRCRSIDRSHPRFEALVRCRDTHRATWAAAGPSADRSMASCFKELLLAVGPRFRSGRGIPELDIEPEDPLTLASAEFAVPQLNVKGSMSDFRMTGLASCLVDGLVNVTVDTRARRGRIDFLVPRSRSTLRGRMTIDFVRTLFPGAVSVGNAGPVVQGDITVDYENTRGVLFLVLARSPDPRRGLVVTNAGLQQTFGEVRAKMVPTFAGGESTQERDQRSSLTNLLNSVLSGNREIREEIMTEIAKPVNLRVAKVKYGLLARGLDHIDLL